MLRRFFPPSIGLHFAAQESFAADDTGFVSTIHKLCGLA